MKRWSARFWLGMLAGAMTLGAGCAQERDPIDRTQPNRMDKRFFVGESLKDASDDPEFRWRTYVVDASASQALIGIGEWSNVDRIRWEITEGLLIARKAYQIADGADNKGVSKADWNNPNVKTDKGFTKTPNGTIVAAYRINSHFDVRRSYNPTTGEEMNVVEENASDRPWQDRQFMRVDWSTNLADNPVSVTFLGKLFGDLKISPVSYYVENPNHDDAPHFEEKNGYFDLTNKFLVSPETTGMWGMPIPMCVLVSLYTGSGTFDCNEQEATLRSSFWKIDPVADADFERLDNTRASEDVVGNPGGNGNGYLVSFVTPPRQGWDPGYGYTDAQLHKFANIHNIWKKSHTDKACLESFDDDGDGTDDQCVGAAKVGGSRCDTFVKKCTLPYRLREVKTFAYWINKEAPDELQDKVDAKGNFQELGTLEDLTTSWNQMLKVAVGTAREVECRNAGDGNREECHGKFFEGDGTPAAKEMVSYGGWLVEKTTDKTPVLTFCHNPVRSYDIKEVCGEVGQLARVGDVRKNFIYYWPYESRAPWGGIANWNGDPLTGQAFGNAAQIMGRSATYAAALQRDVLQLAIGDTTMDDIIKGVPSENFVKQLQSGSAPISGMTPAEQKAAVKKIDLNHLKTHLGVAASKSIKEEVVAQSKSAPDPLRNYNTALEYETWAQKVRGTPLEAQMVDSSWMVSTFGASPTTKIDDKALDAASPLRGMDPGRMGQFDDAMNELFHAKGVCFIDKEAPIGGSVYMSSLAAYFKNKYADLDKIERGKRIYDDLWKDAVKGIALHEIGHSLGMYHNFASSFDSQNYSPQYWQLRTNETAIDKTAECIPDAQGKLPKPETCMGPRYSDPETPDEQGLAGESRPGIEYYANTSTMEYQIERFGETVGLGTYDQHTMKALYGRVLETYDDKVTPVREQQNYRFKNYSQLTERNLIVDGQLGYKHYTNAARLMKVFDPARDCRDATDAEKAKGSWRVVHGKVCQPTPKDHWTWRNFKSDPINTGWEGAPYWHVVDKDGNDRVRWHYKFGQAGNSYFHTGPGDSGADPYELTVNVERRFDQTYPWRYFRRGNREYAHYNVPGRTYSDTFGRLRSYHWQIANDLGRLSRPDQLESDDDLKPYALAEDRMVKLISRAILMPEPGAYSTVGINARGPDGIKALFDTTDGADVTRAAFNLGIVDGRYVSDEFDNQIGGSWDYTSFIHHAGFSSEKVLGMLSLVDSRPSLSTVSRDNALDGRAPKINFRTDMPDMVDRLLGGIFSEDWDTVAPYVAGGDKNPSPVPFDLAAAGATRPTGSRLVFPNLGYKHQLGGVIYAALFSRLNTDMGLVNKMRVWIDGQIGQVNVAPSDQIKFQDPISGYTYVARKYGNEVLDGKTVERGIASRMLQHANALLAGTYEVQRDANNNPVLNSFGQPTLVLDANGKPQTSTGGTSGIPGSTYSSMYSKYVGLIGVVKQINHILGDGPLGGGGGGGGDDE